jgi:MFS family permease
LNFGRTARGLATLYGTTFLLSSGHAMTLPALTVMPEEFGISVGVTAQIVTAYIVGRGVGTPPGGILVDLFGARIVLFVGPTMIGLSALSVVLMPSFPVLIVALFFAGIGDSMWHIGREIAGVDLVRADQRGRLLSGFMGANSIGMGLGAAVGGFITDEFGFRSVYGIYAAMAVVVFLLGLVTPVVRAPARDRPSVGGMILPSVTGFIRITLRLPISLFLWVIRSLPQLVREIEPRFRATYRVLVFATMSMMFYRTVLQSMLPLYGAYRGLSATEVGVLFLIQGLVVFPIIIPAGFVLDKLGRKWATVPTTGFPAVAFILFPFVDSFWQMASLMVLLGAANGFALGSLAVSTYDILPTSSRARLQALRRTVAEVGGIAGPVVGGFIANASNPGISFLASAPLLIIAMLLLGFIAKETLVKPPKPVAAGPPS